MKYLIICLLLAGMVSCKPKNKTAAETTDTITVPDTVNTEYLDYKLFRLNGKIPMMGKYPDDLQHLGKPDSVIIPDDDEGCGYFFETLNERDFKLIYLKGLSFEQKNDSLVFRHIDLTNSPGYFIQFGSLKLDSSTTLDDIKKLFPRTAAEVRKVNSDQLSILLRLSVKPADDGLVLLFDEKSRRLIIVDYWMPC